MVSEAIGGNMHMDTRVIMVADVKSEVIYKAIALLLVCHLSNSKQSTG